MEIDLKGSFEQFREDGEKKFDNEMEEIRDFMSDPIKLDRIRKDSPLETIKSWEMQSRYHTELLMFLVSFRRELHKNREYFNMFTDTEKMIEWVEYILKYNGYLEIHEIDGETIITEKGLKSDLDYNYL